MKHFLVLLAIGMLLLTGCSSSVQTDDIRIATQTNPKVNMSGYKTYAWVGSAAVLRDPSGKWEPPEFDADTEIKFLIDRELRSLGLSENVTVPDVVAAFAVGVDTEALDLKIDPETEMEVAENVPSGALLVVLVDPVSGYVVWAGAATAELMETPDTEMAKARLDYVVTEMFKDLK
ncbi:MAG: DUF4136 domain-containing protein [Planctomycetota bacterium]|jgi:uncharacterized protein YceK